MCHDVTTQSRLANAENREEQKASTSKNITFQQGCLSVYVIQVNLAFKQMKHDKKDWLKLDLFDTDIYINC